MILGIAEFACGAIIAGSVFHATFASQSRHACKGYSISSPTKPATSACHAKRPRKGKLTKPPMSVQFMEAVPQRSPGRGSNKRAGPGSSYRQMLRHLSRTGKNPFMFLTLSHRSLLENRTPLASNAKQSWISPMPSLLPSLLKCSISCTCTQVTVELETSLTF